MPTDMEIERVVRAYIDSNSEIFQELWDMEEETGISYALHLTDEIDSYHIATFDELEELVRRIVTEESPEVLRDYHFSAEPIDDEGVQIMTEAFFYMVEEAGKGREDEPETTRPQLRLIKGGKS